MKIIFAIVLSLLGTVVLLADTSFAQDEYSVYSVVLREIYKENHDNYSAPLFAFLDHASIDADQALVFGNEYKFLTRHFLQLNKKPTRLLRRFPFRKYYFVSTGELNQLLAEGRKLNEQERLSNEKRELKVVSLCGSSWIPFHKKYQDSAGLYKLSRVAFSNNRKIAMVHVSMESNCRGFTQMFILRKSNGKWVHHISAGSHWMA